MFVFLNQMQSFIMIILVCVCVWLLESAPSSVFFHILFHCPGMCVCVRACLCSCVCVCVCACVCVYIKTPKKKFKNHELVIALRERASALLC